MPKKKTIFEGAQDIFEQALTSVKNLSAFFRSTSRDKRTIKSTQKAMKQLSENRTNKEIGEQLGIPYQRVASLKKQIEEGKAYGPELRDLIKEEADQYNETPQQMEGGIYYFPNRDKLEKSVNKIETIKAFPTLIDAKNYWKKIIKSDKFIGITKVRKGKQDFYELVGFGRRSQRPRNGEIKDHRAKNRLQDIMKKYPKA